MNTNYNTNFNSDSNFTTFSKGCKTTVLSLNPFFEHNVKTSVNQILELLDDKQFASEHPHDVEKFKKELFDIIKKNLNPVNVNFNVY